MKKKIKNLKRFVDFVEIIRERREEEYRIIDKLCEERKADVDKWAMDRVKEYKEWEKRFK